MIYDDMCVLEMDFLDISDVDACRDQKIIRVNNYGKSPGFHINVF